MEIRSTFLKFFFFKTIIFSVASALAQSWTQKADFPIVNGEAKGFSVNGKGYVYGGSINKNVEYDPVSDTWTEKNPIPIKGLGGVAFVVGNKAYVGMFNTISGINDSIFEYDPVTDSYTFKTLFPGSNNSNSGYPASFVINNKAYIVVGNNTPGELWEYNPSTNQWSQKVGPPIKLSNSWRAVFSLNGKGYICLASALVEYDPASDSWSNKAPMPNGNGRSGHSAFTIGNYAFVGGGDYLFNSFRDFYKYDPSTDSWSSIDSLPIGSQGAVTFTIGTKGYYVLGVNGTMNFQTKTWEYYDPSITTNLDEQASRNLFNIYPNPNHGQFTIQTEKGGVFELMDITGKVINTYTLTKNVETLNVNLPAGIYFIREKESGSTQKIIME